MKPLNSISKFVKAEAKIPHLRRKLILVGLHAVLLLCLTILLQYTSFVRYDEANFLKFAAIVKHNILNIDPKPLLQNVVFIDVSKDPALVDDDEYGPPDPTMRGAQKVITDRVKLAALFSVLNHHPNEYKYVLCDVLFDKPGPGDSLLKPQIEKVKNIVTPAIADNGKILRPIYKVPSAMVNYVVVNKSTFTKMPVYYNDSLKTLPTWLLEKTTGQKFTKSNKLVYLNGKITFNALIPEFYYRQGDMIKPTAGKGFNTFYLGELLADPDFFSVLKNKFILIGDFSNDTHTTYLGKLPGTLILWDTYLTLRDRPVVISASWLMMLFAFYFLISYWIIIHPERKLKKIHEKVRIPFMSKFIITYISFIGILILENVLSYFYFGTFISLFYIATYLTCLEVLIEKYPAWKKNLYDFVMNM